IPGTAIKAGAFATLVAALGAADLVGAISSPNGPFTVFAPTDDAFAALPNGLVGCLLQEENQPVLRKILLYHVVTGQVLSSDLTDGMEAPTLLDGQDVTVGLIGGVTINNSKVVTANVLATNGVIHIIDQVLVPP
ncbi:beta-Ig-H3/fasciclin, partial [Fragilariopsis cylindrus CCMP1102]